MMPGVSRTVAAVLFIGLGTMNVAADALTTRFQIIAKACQADVATLCQGLPVGGGRIMRCLGENYMNVSTPCRSSMASAMASLCTTDLARLCPGTSLGGGEAEGCLQQHAAELTGSCKTAADRIASSR